MTPIALAIIVSLTASALALAAVAVGLYLLRRDLIEWLDALGEMLGEALFEKE